MQDQNCPGPGPAFVTLYECDESNNDETWEWVKCWVGLTCTHPGGTVWGWDDEQTVSPGTYRLESVQGFADPRDGTFPYAVQATWRRVGPVDEVKRTFERADEMIAKWDMTW